WRGGLDALARRRRPPGRLREHPEDGRLVQPELALSGPDPADDLLRRDAIAVLERLDLELCRVGVLEHMREQRLCLVDAAQDRVLAREDLHCDERIEPLALQDPSGAGEVDVGGVAGQDLAGWWGPDGAHQLRSGRGETIRAGVTIHAPPAARAHRRRAL